MFFKKLKIGNVELENNIVLAPMAGITDLPFRRIVKEFGVGLVYTEMVSSKGLYYQDKKTSQLLSMKEEKRPIAVQLFGSEKESMCYAAKEVSKIADIIDINMGCPAPKVVKNGDGSKLLLNLELIEELVRSVVEVSTVPVTVKIRKGWDEEHIVAVDAAKIIEEAGASAITIHGRTRNEFYSGVADWEIIKDVKEQVKIPVIGNGDVKSPEDAKRMFEQTGVDGIMIGRASFGNPWIFRQVLDYLKTGKYNIPTRKEKLEIMKKHINLTVEEKGENIAIKEMRKQISWYIKNEKESSKMRDRINQITTQKELEDCLIEYFEYLGI